MILGKNTWLALVAAVALVLLAVSAQPTCWVRERLLSARVYWNSQEAVITLTTSAEVNRDNWMMHMLRRGGRWFGLGHTPSVYVGGARVVVLHNGRREDLLLPPMYSPAQFPLWPYYGHLYTWETHTSVREWTGQTLVPVQAHRAEELLRSFPHTRDNYAPSASPTEPDVLQDVVSREAWHSYQRLADLPDGTRVVFPAGEERCEIVVGRNKTGEVELGLIRDNRVDALWEQARLTREVSAEELAGYQRTLPGVLWEPQPGTRWLQAALAMAGLGISLLALALLLAAVMKRRPVPEEEAEPTPMPVTIVASDEPTHEV